VEIDSPPFPRPSTNPTQLHSILLDLRDWVVTHRDWANMEASRLNAPEQPFIPNMGDMPPSNSERYLTLAVPDMYVSWQALRAIREKYDAIVRNYEDADAWVSDACVYHRINLLKSAALLLSVAFLDREKREVREMEIMKEQRKQLFSTLRKVFGIDVGDHFKGDHEDDEQIDFDSLFNPPDEE